MFYGRLSNKNPLIFLHLTRTGGSTLRIIIQNQFPADVSFRIKGDFIEESLRSFYNFSQQQRDGVRFFTGHMPFGMHKYFSLPCDYITLLRDPIAKVISEYQFMSNRVQHPYYQIIKNMSLEDHVLSGVNSVVNYQTRILSGNWGMPHIHSLPLPSDALGVAKGNLRKYFKVVGVTEKFDEMLLVLRKIFGWKNIYYTKNNVSAKHLLKSEISQEVLDIINKNNELDLELHAFAKQLLEDSIKECGPSFEKDLARFKIINGTNFFQIATTVKGKLRHALLNCVPGFVKSGIKNILNKK